MEKISAATGAGLLGFALIGGAFCSLPFFSIPFLMMMFCSLPFYGTLLRFSRGTGRMLGKFPQGSSTNEPASLY
ncbi:MAG TPA: hypothetical protein VNX18_22890 [Bryobacteraceae bacterium]|jgi:hypothetical protein|nr:hypothetical protein [Bryobacteraceae bacterium]